MRQGNYDDQTGYVRFIPQVYDYAIGLVRSGVYYQQYACIRELCLKCVFLLTILVTDYFATDILAIINIHVYRIP